MSKDVSKLAYYIQVASLPYAMQVTYGLQKRTYYVSLELKVSHMRGGDNQTSVPWMKRILLIRS